MIQPIQFREIHQHPIATQQINQSTNDQPQSGDAKFPVLMKRIRRIHLMNFVGSSSPRRSIPILTFVS